MRGYRGNRPAECGWVHDNLCRGMRGTERVWLLRYGSNQSAECGWVCDTAGYVEG